MRVFNIDISRKGISPVVQVTEHDAMSRFFTLVLRNGSSDYEPPENPTYSVWYKTKDSHGWYDTITEPDEGTHPAVVADGNAFTIEIAEQATTSCGELALMINGDDGYQLTVSGIITRSDDIPGYDGEEVENYYNVYITRMQENAARAENAADIAVAYGATVEVDEEAQQLNITHHSDTEGGVAWLFGSAVTSSASGDPATFSDGADDVAVKSLIANIMPVQSGSGDPSPTNVRAISGRTGLTVKRCGRNLGKITLASIADADIGEGSYTLAGLTFSFTKVSDNGVSEIVLNGTPTARATSMLNRDLLVDMPPGRYRLSGCPSGGALNKYRLTCWDNTTSATLASDFGSGATFELVEGHNVNFAIDISQSMASQTISNLVFKPMIRPESDNNDAYEPYNGTSFPITWQTQTGTIYGGTLNVTTGVLTVNGVLHTLDGTEGFALSTNARRFQKAFTTLGWERANTVLSTENQSNSVCSHATYLTGATVTATPADYRITNDSSNLQALNFYDSQSEFANAAAFNAYLAEQYANGTPVQLYYDLATPLDPIQLSPTEIKTLLGGNTIYTDAGSVSVEYVADTKLYIDNKIAELQALVLENN